MSIYHCSQPSIYNASVKQEIQYLRIWVTKNLSRSIELSIENNIDKCRLNKQLATERPSDQGGNFWKDIRLLTKMETLSRFMYPAYSPPPPKITKRINESTFNLIGGIETIILKEEI